MKGVKLDISVIRTGKGAKPDNCVGTELFHSETIVRMVVFNEEVSFINRIDHIIGTVSCLKYNRSFQTVFVLALLCCKL